METATRAPGTAAKARYIPRGRNQLHSIFERRLEEFCDVYDERYAAKYGMLRLERIRDIGERFLTCGDYRLGVARITVVEEQFHGRREKRCDFWVPPRFRALLDEASAPIMTGGR